LDAEVRHADRPDLARTQQLLAGPRGLLDGLIHRPVQLIEVDRLDAEPPQTPLAFLDHFRAARRSTDVRAVVTKAELREDERSPRSRELADGPADDRLRPARAVDRRRVDPVDAVVDRRMDGRDAVRIVLAAPLPAADGPRPDADRRDLEARCSQCASNHYA